MSNMCPFNLGLVDFIAYVRRFDDGEQWRARPQVDPVAYGEEQDLEEVLSRHPKNAWLPPEKS